MKIVKYKKCRNKYNVYFDDGNYISLYEDIILKYSLLLKKEITDKDLESIKLDNTKEEIYDIALKYISIKMRSKKEIEAYLKKKEYSSSDISNTIDRLEKSGFINDDNYAKAYINDKFNLSNSGPNKIKKELLKQGIKEDIIDSYIYTIDEEEIYNKLDRLIDKKIKTTKNCSGNILKQKVINYFINEGYNYSDIEKVIEQKDLNVGDAKKEYEKLYNRYSKKYSGYELDMIIKQKLYQKGYNYDKIN